MPLGAGEERPTARRGGKSGQLKGRVTKETWFFLGRPKRRDRATETNKGETLLITRDFQEVIFGKW